MSDESPTADASAGRPRGRGSRRGRQGKKPNSRDPHRKVNRRELETAAEARRAVTLAPISYPAELPVSARRDDIAAAIRDHQVVIVAGETGSGKTTQLPKICLDLGRGREGQIGHTQPRRIAARSVAERIAEELGTQLGDTVGYQVRFTDQSSDTTLVKVMTDGILLAQIQRDPDLLAYDTLIIDEAHERSLNIDFLLGYLTNLLPRRPDLKIIITSATIDSERFARHFAPGGPLPPLEAAPDAMAPAVPEPAVASAVQDTAPVVEVTGRTYPVEIRYRPLAGETRGDEVDQATGIVAACDELLSEGAGDILVFLSGEREIRDAADALEGHLGPRARDPKHPRRVEILPLYSRLSAAEQHRVFEAHSARRIVLATNVAETSLTVPGIHYVVDPGTARISRYSKATKVQRLPIEPISRASANQRSGRAGRLADGIAIRLYSEEDFDGRPAFTEPEILRTSLASVLLQMIAVGVVSSPNDVAAFPFVEPPDTRAIRDGVQLLSELGAIEVSGGVTRLTSTGRSLSRLPMDPRAARMVVEGSRRGVAREVAIVAAALSIQDPRERPAEVRETADALHRRFADPTSDLLTYLNLWEHLRSRRRELSGNQFRREVRAEHLNYLRIREWQDVVEQIRIAAKPLGIEWARRDAVAADAVAGSGGDGGSGGGRPSDGPRAGSVRYVWDEEAIHRSVLSGLLSQIGMQETGEPKASQFSHLSGGAREAAMRRAKKQARNEYLGSRGTRFAIFPGSALSKKPPAFVMAAELVETSRLWARDVAAIQPEWAEELAGDLAKRTHSEPVWSAKRGAAVATERVLLYGVPIVTDRTVLWGRLHPEEARELFIRHALVQGEWRTHHRFWKDNQRVLAEAEELEARTRSRGLIVDEDTLFDFYDERLPESIVSQRHFDRWWDRERRRSPRLLTFSLDDVAPEHEDLDLDAFPDAWPQGDLTLPLTYQLSPGSAADGVTVHIPVEVLARVVADGFDWMVPGMADDLATATIRALPKSVRRLLVPAPDAARAVVAWLRAETPAWEDVARAGDMAEPYREAFTRAVRALRDVEIPAEAWDGHEERLPDHLRMTFRVEDGREVLGESTSLLSLQRRLAPEAQAAVAAALGTPAGVARRDRGKPSPQQGSRDDTAGTSGTAPGAATMLSGAIEQRDLSGWPTIDGSDGDLIPAEVTVQAGTATVRGYPALAAEDGSVSLRVLAHAEAVTPSHTAGVAALLLAECGLATKRVTTRWNTQQAMALGASPYRTTDALVTDLHRAAIARLTASDALASVRDRAAYEALRDRVRAGLEDEVLAVADTVAQALAAHRDLDVAIGRANSLALLTTLADIRAVAGGLIYDGFVAATPPERLPHLARYLTALPHRLEKAASNPHQDAVLTGQVRDVAGTVAEATTAYERGRPDPERAARLERARWLVEELRVSLFAQRLGTSEPVSAKRILKELA